jgi:ABC-2 type transport system permease protein
MNKILDIAWKDTLTAFRDPAALVLMLLTPFALTLAIAFAFGRFAAGGSQGGGLSDIPVILVNHDPGQMGAALVQVMEGPDLADLLDPLLVDDEEEARALVDADKAAAVVIIPANFSASILLVDAGTALSPDQQLHPAH